jgi:alcohol dehydrogenase, propanol-preferring
MLAVRLHAAGEPLRLAELPLPEPTGSQVRVRVAACGVCHTDLHIVSGRQPRVELPVTLGHEIAGWIDAAGPGAKAGMRHQRLRPGDPVLVFGGWGCGRCEDCEAGEEQRCPDGRSPGFQVDGGYAEALLVPDPRHLVPLGRLDPVRAAPLADAGVTPFRAVRRALPWLTRGGTVAVIGLGGLGQFAVQYLRHVEELRVAVREVNPAKVALAEELGADVGVLDGDPALLLTALGSAADVVFDFVGSEETLALAAGVVAPGGLVMLVGEAGGGLPFGFEALPAEASLSTTSWGSSSDLREVVRLARTRRIRWEVETLPLREAPRGHQRLARGEVSGRLVLVP